MAKKILTYKGVVFAWECDTNGHMNVMYYINKFEQAGHNFIFELGVFPKPDHQNGIVVVDQHIQYHHEVFEDDCLYAESQLIKIGTRSLTVRHTLYEQRSTNKVSTMDVVIVPFDKVNRSSYTLTDEQKNQLKCWL